MSYQVLARKWRPKTFETLVGQPHVVTALINALEQQRLHHAYLFTGTRGVGKTTLARILAKSLNCETGISAKPCGQCNACTEIDKGRFVDLLEVDAASNTQVDAMRELLENAQYAPTVGRFKVYIIDEVHMLSKSAFNAMLKTLEEPPAHVKFILATTDPQKVPVTVLSRCLQFNLRQMASMTISEHLTEVLTQEDISFEPTAIQLISRAAEGSMRDALSLTDQAIAYGNQTVNESEVRSMLGAIDQSYLFEIVDAILNNDGSTLIAKAKQMEARSLSFEAALNDLANLLHQVAIAKTVPTSIANDLPERQALLDLAEKIPADTLQLYYQIALLGRRDIGLAPDEYAGFTMSLLRMLAFAPNERVSGQANNTRAEVKPTESKKSETKTTNAEVKNTTALQEKVESAQAESTDQDASIQKKTTEQPTKQSSNFDGNWRNLVEKNLKLGLARALAQQCEMVAYDENSITLRVEQDQKHLVSTSYQAKLSSAINDYFDKKIRLSIQVVEKANTPAKQNAEEKATLLSNTEQAMMKDEFVQSLIKDFDAQVIPNTIKPNTQT